MNQSAAAAAAKSLPSCPTLCDPINSSPPGSSIHGIFQARVLEWGAIAFSRISLADKNQTSRQKDKAEFVVEIALLKLAQLECGHKDGAGSCLSITLGGARCQSVQGASQDKCVSATLQSSQLYAQSRPAKYLL